MARYAIPANRLAAFVRRVSIRRHRALARRAQRRIDEITYEYDCGMALMQAISPRIAKLKHRRDKHLKWLRTYDPSHPNNLGIGHPHEPWSSV